MFVEHIKISGSAFKYLFSRAALLDCFSIDPICVKTMYCIYGLLPYVDCYLICDFCVLQCISNSMKKIFNEKLLVQSCHFSLVIHIISLSESDDEDDEEDDEEEEEEMIPTFIKQLKEEYILLCGQPLTLEVEIQGKPKPKVTWYYESEKLQTEGCLTLTEKGDIYTLHIPEAILDDEGVYKVLAKNTCGEAFMETEVLVDEIEEDSKPELNEEPAKMEPAETKKPKKKPVPPPSTKPKPKILQPPTFVSPLENLKVTQGNLARFEVEIESESDVTAAWYKGDDVITSEAFSNMIVISTSSLYSLIIEGAQLLDTATYTCLAKNKSGEVSCSSELLVMRKFDVFNGKSPQ